MVVLEYDELHARLLATIALQEQIADQWTWDEKTVRQWGLSRAALVAAKEALDGAEASDALAVGALEKASAELHEATKQALGLAKVRFRNTPETLRDPQGVHRASGQEDQPPCYQAERR